MPFEYVSVEEAIARRGLRMVVVGNVPSPWGEAAKGILHIKRIAWTAVRLAYDNEALQKWAGQRNGPIAIYDDEHPRPGWAEILLLAERLAPAPALIPVDAAERALMFGLAHECAMDPSTRAAFETRSAEVDAALDDVLFEHRDRVYAEWLELPLSM